MHSERVAGRFFTTELPGKLSFRLSWLLFYIFTRDSSSFSVVLTFPVVIFLSRWSKLTHYHAFIPVHRKEK